MVFTEKTIPTTSKISKTELDPARSGSPVDSVMAKAPSFALPQAPWAGYFSKWTKRPAPFYPVIFRTATSPPVDPVIRKLASKNAQLRDDNEQMKEVCAFNQLTLRKIADELESKDKECEKSEEERKALRAAIHMLDKELKRSTKSSLPRSGKECVRELNRILCEKNQRIAALADELQNCQGELKVADSMSARNTALLVHSLARERSRITELHHTITEKDEQLSELEISLESTQSSHASLYNERLQLSQALTLAMQVNPSLQRENNELAARAAAVETTNANIVALIPALKTQVEDLMTSLAAQTAKHRAQVDAMYAQNSQARDQSKARLIAKDTAIRELQAQLDLADTEAGKDVAAHDVEIALLQDQLARLALQKEDEEAQKAAWQDYADEQRSRGDTLEANSEAQVATWRNYARQQESRGNHFLAQKNV
jgi:chromosome segregation ATPase